MNNAVFLVAGYGLTWLGLALYLRRLENRLRTARAAVAARAGRAVRRSETPVPTPGSASPTEETPGGDR